MTNFNRNPGRSLSMKLKHYGVALVPICLAAFLLRAMELILAIDPRTGFFATGSVLPWVFDGFLILAALFFASVLFMKREPKPAVVRLYRASVFDTVLGILGSVLLVTSALFGLFRQIVGGTLTLDWSLFANASLWELLLSLLTAVFLIFFVTYPKQTAKNNGWRIMSLSLTVYYVFLLVKNFQQPDVVFSRAFGIYLITFYGVAAASGINFSKILARLFGRKLFVFFTCLMAVISAVRLADTVLSVIPGNPYGIPLNLFEYFGNLCITLLMICQMKKLMLKRKKPVLAEEPVAEEISAEESVAEEPIPEEEIQTPPEE